MSPRFVFFVPALLAFAAAAGAQELRPPSQPIRIDPIPIEARQPQRPAPYAMPAPALVIPRPTVITTCDAAGCWDSEGRRLNYQGPLLMSPQGLCVQQGGTAACP